MTVPAGACPESPDSSVARPMDGYAREGMSSSHSLTLLALDVPVGVDIRGAAADAAVNAIRAAWGPLVVGTPAAAGRNLDFTADETAGIEHLLDSLSSRVTLEGIEERSGELLMLHAAGLADPASGRVIACVASSGTGKTTLSRTAAGRLHYVTDETVAVTPEGVVIRYPKPLSVKQPGGGYRPKLQHGPESIGLTLAPAEGLALGGIVLLNRIEQDDASIDQEPLPRVEPLGLFEAIVALVPELSYLSRMQRPLHRIAVALLSTGGGRRLHYREATEAIPLLKEMLRDAPSWGTADTGLLRGSATELELWIAARQTMLASGSSSAAAEPLRTAAALDDLLIDRDRGMALIFSGNRVSLVSSIAAATLVAAGDGIGRTDLRDYLGALFGDPPAPGEDGVDPVDGVIDSLIDHGLLEPSATR